MFIDD